jgi:multimeric flavodoxin WrbA
VQSDLVAWLTPVTFGGYSSELKSALDRSIPTVSPFFEVVDGEIHHRKRYETTPALMLLGSAEDPAGGEATTFRGLFARNVRNMRPPTYAVDVVGRDADDHAITAALGALVQEVL